MYCRSQGFRLSRIFLIKSLISCSKSSVLLRGCVKTSSRGSEVLIEYLVPGGTIGVSKNVLELQKRFFPAPAQTGTHLIELGECLFKEELHTKGTTVNADLCFCISTLELIFLGKFGTVIPFAFEQKDGFLLKIAGHLG